MRVAIPAQYNPFVFSLSLYKIFNGNFPSTKQLNREIKKESFKTYCEENAVKFTEPKTFAETFSVKFVVKYGIDNYVYYGNNQTLLAVDLSSDTNHFYTVVQNFYYFPKGLSKNAQYFSRIDSVLNLIQKNSKTVVIEPCPLASKKLRLAEDKYDISIDIWTKKELKNKTYQFTQIRNSPVDKKVTLKFHFQRETKTFMYIQDEKLYFSNFHKCKNFKKGCLYQFSNLSKMKKHEKTCITVEEAKQNPTITQTEYGLKKHPLEDLVENGFLEKYVENENFVFFDIESVLQKIGNSFGKTCITHSHSLVSIAVNAFVNNKHDAKCWVVTDSSLDSQNELTKKFLEFCLSKKEEMILEPALVNSINKINEILEDEEIDKMYKKRILGYKYKLKNYTDLVVLGYNSSKYDNNVLIGSLLKAVSELTDQKPKVIKKTNKYFSIQILGLHFKDLINFTSPMPLSKYLKTWSNDEKLLYPYEKFEDIESIRKCKEFPPISAFKTLKKVPVDTKVYQKCKSLYDYHSNLPVDDPEHWKDFSFYLIFYNLNDVVPTSKGVIKQFSVFKKMFGLSPMQSYGLPSYGSKIMYSMYNDQSPSIITFPDKCDATAVFREQMIGGLTQVYKRHCTLLNESAAESAICSKNGESKIFKIDAGIMSASRC